MIQINRNEADKIRGAYPEIHIRRTANKYYVEEVPKALMLIGRYVPQRGGGPYAGKARRRKQF